MSAGEHVHLFDTTGEPVAVVVAPAAPSGGALVPLLRWGGRVYQQLTRDKRTGRLFYGEVAVVDCGAAKGAR